METKFKILIEKSLKNGMQNYLILEDDIIISEGSGQFIEFMEITKASFSNLEVEFINSIEKFKNERR